MNKSEPPVLIFARSDAAVDDVAMRMAQLRPHSAIGYLTKDTGPLALRQVIVGMSSGEFPIVVASPRWVEGWRAPLGTLVLFGEGFPEELRAQAAARAPK
jgi:hypothetical protein